MFIEQAYKGNNAWWRIALTTLFCTGIFLMNFVLILMLSPAEMKTVYDTAKNIPNNIGLVINLLPFAFLLGLLFLMVYGLHKRSVLSLTTSRRKVDLSKIFFSCGLIVLLSVIGFAITYYMDDSNIVWNFKPFKFAVLVIISLLLFPFQIGFEEYLFRGYLMQQIGVIARNRWFPLAFTSVIFGLFHSANPEVADMGFGVMAFYIGTGLLLGIMTLMDESLELALGFHLGNNLMAALLITTDSSALQTDALFRYTGAENSGQMLNEMLVTIAITYPIVLFILAKKYNWKNWREKLAGKVKKENLIEI
ncbi:MAG TPA: CPBP family intramembrane glutamic endopeptidase [Flavobacterium sp.]|nr:CPBP family intramembrane glutamic endopeptidase [Flavobacterium sp.]